MTKPLPTILSDSEAWDMAQRMFETHLAAKPVNWNSPSPEKREEYLSNLISSYFQSAKFFLEKASQ